MSVKVSHLSKIFETQRAVDDVSFEAHKGEVLGFLGPNGAGKTTCFYMIVGLVAPATCLKRVARWKFVASTCPKIPWNPAPVSDTCPNTTRSTAICMCASTWNLPQVYTACQKPLNG